MTVPDHAWMRRALRLAARGEGRTSPNPMVGSVIVAGDRLLGAGYHKEAGGPHAEVWALRAAGDAARGATIYVTLEPCSHHGRTPPCADAIIQAGLRRVVAACLDPNPQVDGRGVHALRSAGIEVELGLLEQEARRLNSAYFKHTATGLPLVSLKAAMSLDGKIATRTGESRWITGERARRFAHRLRATHDAVMVGVRTVLADDPKLTARVESRESKVESSRESRISNLESRPPDVESRISNLGRQMSNLESRISTPLRVVVDSTARTPPDSALLTADKRPPIIAVTENAPQERTDALQRAGAEVWVIPSSGERVDLTALMRRLGEGQVQSVLLEGGGTLAAAALAAGLVDRVYFLIAPLLIGGAEAPTALGGEGIARLADAWPITNVKTRRIGEDLLISGDIVRG